jgi:hypothetical protein
MSQRDVDLIRQDGGAKFNGSMLMLMRLHNHLTKCAMASSGYGMISIRQWVLELQNLERELWSYATEKEREEIEKYRFSAIPPLHTKDMFNAENKYRERCDKWEKSLRDVMNRKGLGMVASKRASDLILGGG